MRLISIFVLVFSMYCTYGQTLSLEDIFKVRSMDSVELSRFSNLKGFKLREVEIDIWRSVHKYYSADSSIWFERNFPTGRKLFGRDTTKRDNRIVYYHFTNKETVNEFKKIMKEKGYKFKRTNTKNYGGSIFLHNIYVNKDTEIDIATDRLRGLKEKYTLMYYRRMN